MTYDQVLLRAQNFGSGIHLFIILFILLDYIFLHNFSKILIKKGAIAKKMERQCKKRKRLPIKLFLLKILASYQYVKEIAKLQHMENHR